MASDQHRIAKIERDAVSLSTDLATHISEVANLRPVDEINPFAGTTGSLVFQTLAVYLTLTQFPAGSAAGERHLREMYEQALADTLERWRKPDLKGLGTVRSH